MAKDTRFYEVAAPRAAEAQYAEHRVYLVEAENPSQAERAVARRYVGDAKLVDAKRAMELVGKANTIRLDAAVELRSAP